VKGAVADSRASIEVDPKIFLGFTRDP
jgi:hypothetical protein